VKGLQPGDDVMGISEGSFAELAIAHPDKLVPKPANLTFEQAAAIPTSGITALRAVREVGRSSRGRTSSSSAGPERRGNARRPDGQGVSSTRERSCR
jgi:NADPH:quinone reductase-like Zn-dependent oxidoreductase